MQRLDLDAEPTCHYVQLEDRPSTVSAAKAKTAVSTVNILPKDAIQIITSFLPLNSRQTLKLSNKNLNKTVTDVETANPSDAMLRTDIMHLADKYPKLQKSLQAATEELNSFHNSHWCYSTSPIDRCKDSVRCGRISGSIVGAPTGCGIFMSDQCFDTMTIPHISSLLKCPGKFFVYPIAGVIGCVVIITISASLIAYCCYPTTSNINEYNAKKNRQNSIQDQIIQIENQLFAKLQKLEKKHTATITSAAPTALSTTARLSVHFFEDKKNNQNDSKHRQYSDFSHLADSIALNDFFYGDSLMDAAGILQKAAKRRSNTTTAQANGLAVVAATTDEVLAAPPPAVPGVTRQP